jgi:hypothetical protein
VPAGDRLISLLEPHADIIIKGSREVHYGHKLSLTTGRSGLMLDLVIETGKPGGQRAAAADAGALHRVSMAKRRVKQRPTAALPAATT